MGDEDLGMVAELARCRASRDYWKAAFRGACFTGVVAAIILGGCLIDECASYRRQLARFDSCYQLLVDAQRRAHQWKCAYEVAKVDAFEHRRERDGRVDRCKDEGLAKLVAALTNQENTAWTNGHGWAKALAYEMVVTRTIATWDTATNKPATAVVPVFHAMVQNK